MLRTHLMVIRIRRFALEYGLLYINDQLSITSI